MPLRTSRWPSTARRWLRHTAAAALREAWAESHERISLLAREFVPKALQLGSTAEQLTALIPSNLRLNGQGKSDETDEGGTSKGADSNRAASESATSRSAARKDAVSKGAGGGRGKRVGGKDNSKDNITRAAADADEDATQIAQMTEAEHLDAIDTFVQATRAATHLLHPTMSSLSKLVTEVAYSGVASGGQPSERRPAEGAPSVAVAESSLADADAQPGTASRAEHSAQKPLAGSTAGKSQRQERNLHALTVLRRIKCKLDGMDKWPGKARETKQGVAEQVEAVIKQAISPDNLCAMYEGWTPWC